MLDRSNMSLAMLKQDGRRFVSNYENHERREVTSNRNMRRHKEEGGAGRTALSHQSKQSAATLGQDTR
jgi:hypothetical protein